jgi:Cys-tRNA(Pro)/Cys-tRNA(Cys) deacylase
MTPAINALQKARVAFQLHEYEHDPGNTAFGDEVVQKLGQEPARVFKTLIATVEGRGLVVGIVPVSASLDLKALAAAVGGKRASMTEVAEAERATGYVAGGISPLGQRKHLATVLDASAAAWSTVFVSGGRRGLQLELAPDDLRRLTGAMLAPIARP